MTPTNIFEAIISSNEKDNTYQSYCATQSSENDVHGSVVDNLATIHHLLSWAQRNFAQ